MLELARIGVLLTRLAIIRALERAINGAIGWAGSPAEQEESASFQTADSPAYRRASTRPHSQSPRRTRHPVGISNRPLEEELRSQARVPPRGAALGETDPLLLPRPDQHPAPRDAAPKLRRGKYPSA
jgi:hypothetical protein